ncbi:MptD family putative ECF transporter S component [Microbacterium sp. LWO14-1.2]|uniref:hypothetical protein n=1 Tax=Microbacterium sp. LWO14-1.2 TaxID=3135263 RepID=UPI003138C49A
MITLRWAAVLWAVICLVGLFFAPHGWPSAVLALVFAALCGFILWTFGDYARSDPNSRKDPDMATNLDAARNRLAAARSAVIEAEEALDEAIARRDRAERDLYRAEEQEGNAA